MSPRGIDRKAVGGVVGGARHRMIALIRADGRLEKRAGLACNPGVAPRKRREG